MKLNDLVLSAIELYFIYFFIFLNNWEPYTNIPIGTKGINIFVALVLLIALLYTIFYLSYIINTYVLKKEFEIKVNAYFYYVVVILFFIFNIIIANTTNSFFMKYGDTRKDCPQAYASICPTGQPCSVPGCKEINIEYANGKEITKRYYPIYSIFINEYITKFTSKLI